MEEGDEDEDDEDEDGDEGGENFSLVHSVSIAIGSSHSSDPTWQS